jgi:hypothetical protein
MQKKLKKINPEKAVGIVRGNKILTLTILDYKQREAYVRLEENEELWELEIIPIKKIPLHEKK